MKGFFSYAKNRFLYNLLRLAIIFLLGLLASQFLFIPKVNALQTEPSSVQFLDNYGSSLSFVSTDFVDNVYYGYFGLTAGTTGGAVAIRLQENIVEYHMYSLTINVGVPSGGYTTASSKNVIGIGTNIDHAISSYVNANNSVVNYTQGGTYDAPHYLSIIFTAYSTGSYIVVPYNVQNSCYGSCENFFKGYTLTDLGSSENLSDTEVNNIINNQTIVIQDNINNLQSNIQNSITNTEQNINSNIQSSQDNINSNIQSSQDSINSNINDMQDSINNTITDNFNSCRDSYNLLNLSNFNSSLGGILLSNLQVGKTYTFSSNREYSWFKISDSPAGLGYVEYTGENIFNYTFTAPENVNNLYLFLGDSVYWDISTSWFISNAELMLNEGSSSVPYEPYGEICQNKIDATNDKLDQAEETRKGIWATIKDLPNQFLNMLKGLFIPDDNFFTNWFDEFMSFVEMKLGFLATPFTIFIDFIESYSNLSSNNDVIIEIPDITVPNFEDHVLIKATSFNWSQTLKSKESLNNLWTLYLDFVDVFLILNFIGLCERIYNRIFGGDTSNYEYYTVEDSYTYDNDTGEVLSSRRNERTTIKRKRSDN